MLFLIKSYVKIYKNPFIKNNPPPTGGVDPAPWAKEGQLVPLHRFRLRFKSVFSHSPYSQFSCNDYLNTGHAPKASL